MSMTVDYVSGSTQYQTNSITAYWWGQAEAGGYTSATQNFLNSGGTTTSFYIPFGCIVKSMNVWSSGVSSNTSPTLPLLICGIEASWTGVDGEEYGGSCGKTGDGTAYLMGTWTLPTPTVSGQVSTTVPIGFYWASYDGYLSGFGTVYGPLPYSVTYSSLGSTGAIAVSEASDSTLATSDSVTNGSSSTLTQSLSATYTYGTSQTVLDSNLTGGSSSTAAGQTVSFNQTIDVVLQSGSAATSAYTVTATVPSGQALAENVTASKEYTSSMSVQIPPGDSAQIVITGIPLSAPISFSATALGTYSWYCDGGAIVIVSKPTTLTFSDFSTTLGLTSTVSTVPL